MLFDIFYALNLLIWIVFSRCIEKNTYTMLNSRDLPRCSSSPHILIRSTEFYQTEAFYNKIIKPFIWLISSQPPPETQQYRFLLHFPTNKTHSLCKQSLSCLLIIRFRCNRSLYWRSSIVYGAVVVVVISIDWPNRSVSISLFWHSLRFKLHAF